MHACVCNIKHFGLPLTVALSTYILCDIHTYILHTCMHAHTHTYTHAHIHTHITNTCTYNIMYACVNTYECMSVPLNIKQLASVFCFLSDKRESQRSLNVSEREFCFLGISVPFTNVQGTLAPTASWYKPERLNCRLKRHGSFRFLWRERETNSHENSFTQLRKNSVYFKRT
jgi:hypothetical protein